MAYSSKIKLVVGDTLPVLNFTLKDSNTAASGATLDAEDSDTWAPIDLSGGTIKLRTREVGTSTVLATITCTIVSPTAGTVTCTFPSATWTAAGTYEGEIEYTTSSSAVQTVQDFIKFVVRDDFD
tara:strand:- start:74 stop:448 length:375 start_codon:yes stop_codon:yes gene_type:complete